MKKTVFPRRVISVLLSICLLVTMLSGIANFSAVAAGSYEVAASFAGGTGTADDPYQITNASELAKMLKGYGRVDGTVSDAPAYYILMNDIDLNPTENWAPDSANTAGYADWKSVDPSKNTAPFSGHLDGNGKTISHLYINNGTDYNKFGALIQNFDISATVKNLTMKDFYCRGTQTAAVAAVIRAVGTQADVNFSGVSAVGGIIENTHASGGGAGSIVAWTTVSKAIIQNCYAEGVYFTKAHSATKAGAIIGRAQNDAGAWTASVKDCSAINCGGVSENIGGALGNGTNGSFVAYSVDIDYASGNGTKNNPYHIKNASQLYRMVMQGGVAADGTSQGYFVLDNDIVLNSTLNWNPDPTNKRVYNVWNLTGYVAFKGNFNGKGYKISGLYTTDKKADGFITKTAAGAVISDVVFENCYVRGNAWVGTVVGTSDGVTMTNVMVKNSTVIETAGWGSNKTGSIIGLVNDGKTATYVNCAVVNVSAQGLISGGADWNTPTQKITNCFAVDCTATKITCVKTQPTTKNVYVISDPETIKGDAAKETMPELDYAFTWKLGNAGEYPTLRALDIPEVWDGDKTATITSMQGSGTAEDPYQVTSGAELYAAVNTIANSATPDVCFELQNDIYLNDPRNILSGYTSVATNWYYASSVPFVGTLDGNNHTVYGLYADGTSTWGPNGLIRSLGMGGEIRDINVEGAYVKTIQFNGAGLVGQVAYVPDGTDSYTKAAVIDGCSVTNSYIEATYAGAGTITAGQRRSAALVGYINLEANSMYGSGVKGPVSLKLSNSFAADNTVVATGGQTGNNAGLIGHCYAYADTGNTQHKIYVTNCYSDGNVPFGGNARDSFDIGLGENSVKDVYAINLAEGDTSAYKVDSYADMTGLFDIDNNDTASYWYQAYGKTPILVRKTENFTYPDLDGDFIDEAPDADSVAIIRRALLGIKGFNLNNAVGNVNGDSAADGTADDVFDILDLIRIKKYVAGVEGTELQKKN